MLLFKRILDFQKPPKEEADKRGAKRYPVGPKYPLKVKLTLVARDSEGHPLPPAKCAPMDWGGQLANFSSAGAHVKLHPAAVTECGDACTFKLELDNVLFEVEGTVANVRSTPQYVSCGVAHKFPDNYTRKAYQQLMEPVLIGSSLELVPGKIKPDRPGLVKEQYAGESESLLSIWRESAGAPPKEFELLLHDYYLRGNAEQPRMTIGYRDGARVGRQISRPSFPVPMAPAHQAEVARLFQFVVQNLSKSIPAEVRKFLELFAA